MSAFPFQSIAFDLDGTLVDTAPDLTEALNHALVMLGRARVPQEAVRNMVGHGARAMLDRGLAATGGTDPALVEEGFPIFLAYYEAHIADQRRLEGLAATLIGALRWETRFAALIGGDTLPVRKPDPAPLHEAIARLGGGRAAFIGDSITDTDTARAAGIPCIAVSFGFSDRPVEQLGATALIDHYDELIPALERLA